MSVSYSNVDINGVSKEAIIVDGVGDNQRVILRDQLSTYDEAQMDLISEASGASFYEKMQNTTLSNGITADVLYANFIWYVTELVEISKKVNTEQAAGNIYPDVASGEEATVDGEYFWVVSADDSEVLELWLMGESTATDTGKRTASDSAVDLAQLNSNRARFHIYGNIKAFNHNSDLSVTLSSGRLTLYKGDTADIATITDLTIPNGQCAYVDLDAPLDGNGKLQVFVGNARVGEDNNDWISGSKIILLNVLGQEIGGLLTPVVAQFSADKANAVLKGSLLALKWDTANNQALITTPTLFLQIGGIDRIITTTTDLAIPNGGCAYVDLSDETLDIKVSSSDVGTTTNDSRYPFAKDSLFILLSVDNVSSKRLGGPLAPVSFIPRNHEQARICEVHGHAEFITQESDSTNCFVKFSGMRIFVGATGQTLVLEDYNGPLLQQEALVINLDDALVGGRQPVHKVSSGVSSVQNGDGGFISDNKVLLFYWGSDSQYSGLLAQQYRERNFNARLGEVVIPGGDVEVTFDPATRTLAWSGDLYFHTTETNPVKAGNRIRLNAGSVTFDASEFQVAWLDLREALQVDTPATAVKVGKYFTGSNRFNCRDYQVPIFWYSAGQYDRIGGFPRPVVDTPPQVASTDFMVLEQSADNLFIYRKGSNAESNKWLRIDLQYIDDTANVDPDKRYNVWRIRRVYLATRDAENGAFTLDTDVTTAGEWECAIKEAGAGDFMGGQNHGNEFMQYATILADGKKLDPSASGTFNIKRLELTQKTHLTQWGSNNENHVATRYMRWDISDDEMILSNRVEWLDSLNLSDSFMAMLPIYRDRNALQITDTGIRNPEWVEEDMTVAGFPQVNSKSDQARIWGNESGINAEMEVVKGWDKPNRTFFFSASASYNKMYFDFTNTYTTQIGEVWDMETIYKIDVNS